MGDSAGKPPSAVLNPELLMMTERGVGAEPLIQFSTWPECYELPVNVSVSEDPALADWLKIIAGRLVFRGVL